ncbi:hypothetical protein PtA15_3A253 [Puccinia triticina]|uniref:Uncharacterized protein n=1 Tax=Puccinia triticina TaxID=208348 RepID=A0ABY7CET7_9BASI|nr:uncharacterized protein PtA15_3A253 [Puccinia triticina]WAQ82888.1 hypothetical protein PtA15_3A253 [Puccinia triticina]
MFSHKLIFVAAIILMTAKNTESASMGPECAQYAADQNQCNKAIDKIKIDGEKLPSTETELYD